MQYLRTFDWLGLGLISAIFGYLFGVPWRKSLQEEPWRLSFIPIASVALIYLPVYAGQFDTGDVRYYWVTFPFLIAASFGFTLHVSGAMFKHRAVQRALALAVVTLSLIIGNERVFRQAFSPSGSASSDYHASKILANKLRAAGLIGSVAAVGPLPVDARYVAYLLNVQSFGHIRKYEWMTLRRFYRQVPLWSLCHAALHWQSIFGRIGVLPVLTNNCSAAMRRMKIRLKSS